jgi:hypothetical protein
LSTDADDAAEALRLLARFAERVREADGPPAATGIAHARRLLARAALVLEWPTVRAGYADRPPTSDATLTATARQLAEQCRTRKGGWLGSWPTDLLAEAAERLGQLADRLDALHRPTGPLAKLDRIVEHWMNADRSTVALGHLDADLATLLGGRQDDNLGPRAKQFDARLVGWPVGARGVAVVLCELLDRLVQKTGDRRAWDEVRRWVKQWFGGTAAVEFETTDLPAAGRVDEFALADGRRVYLAVTCAAVEPVADAGPVVGADGSSFTWPEALSRDSDQPFDTILEVQPLVLSDGPLSPAFAAFHALFTSTAGRPDWWDGGRWRRARQLCKHPDPAAVAALAVFWMDECSPADVDAVCRWAQACGLEVISPDGPGATVRSVFAAAPAGTRLGAGRVGFRCGDEVFREAVAEVSLGPLPPGLAELEQAAVGLPAGELRERVGGLRAAAEGHYLREAVLRLYTDFWGEAGGTARQLNPTATAAVGERLTAILAEAFALHPFHPANVHDLPSGWITVAAGSRVMTGVVTRVLRPGLQDDHGQLRIPAVVEVE